MRLAIFVFLTGCFLLVGSREQPWGDARIMYEVAESVVARQSIAVRSEWPPMSHKGADGRVYSQYAAGPSLVSIPGVMFRNTAVTRDSPDREFWLVVSSHVAPAMLGALTCLLFFGLSRRLGASPWAATAGTLTLAFATMILVYARSTYSEILQTACVLGFLSALLAVVDAPTRRNALYLGAWASAVLNAKAVLVLALLGGGLHLILAMHRDRAALARVIGWSLATAAPGLGLFMLYNHLRWGSPFDTGYGETLSLLGENPLNGLWGLLLSPGKSLFLYSPPLVLGVLSSVAFARAHPGPARALVLVGTPPLLFYACMLSWSGDWCWGPRYITYLVPLVLLPAVVSGWPVIVRSRAARIGAALVLVAGLSVQTLGVAFYWDHWIRIALNTRLSWLGNPNRDGAASKLNQYGLCDNCFEDMSGHHWLPPFAAVPGHAWMLRNRGQDWVTAQRTAPWRRHTTLEMPQIDPYWKKVRLDWWVYLWLEKPSVRVAGALLLLLFVTLVTGGGVMWWRRVRAAAL